MEFNVISQSLKCPNCSIKAKIENNPTNVREHRLDIHAKNKIKVEDKASTNLECEGCGAVVEVEATSSATTCPYCGSHYVLSHKQIESIIPDGVIPFKVEKHDVEEIFRKWIKGRWLAPNILKTLYQKDKVQGIYIPYWTFDANTNARYTAMGGKNYEVEYEDEKGEKHTRIETRWYTTSGYVSNLFDDVLVRASNKLDETLLKCIEPYNTRNTASYSPKYMSGYLAEVYNIDLKDAHNEAMNIMENQLVYLAERDVLIRYDRVRGVSLNTSFSKETYKHIFIPVYSTAYTYKEKRYNVLINGETGIIKGEYPKSIAKIITIIVFIIVMFAIGYFITSEDEAAYKYEGATLAYIETIDEDDNYSIFNRKEMF